MIGSVDLAAVRLDDSAADGQAKAHTAGLAPSGRGAEEGRVQVPQRLFVETDAVVAHADLGLTIIVGVEAQLDLRAGRAVLVGVAQEVIEDEDDEGRLGVGSRDVFVAARDQGCTAVALVERVDGVFDNVLEGDRLAVGRRHLRPCEDEQVLDYAAQAAGLADQVLHRQEAVSRLENVAAVEKEEAVADNGRDRRAELVGDEAEEVVLDCNGPAQALGRILGVAVQLFDALAFALNSREGLLGPLALGALVFEDADPVQLRHHPVGRHGGRCRIRGGSDDVGSFVEGVEEDIAVDNCDRVGCERGLNCRLAEGVATVQADDAGLLVRGTDAIERRFPVAQPGGVGVRLQDRGHFDGEANAGESVARGLVDHVPQLRRLDDGFEGAGLAPVVSRPELEGAAAALAVNIDAVVSEGVAKPSGRLAIGDINAALAVSEALADIGQQGNHRLRGVLLVDEAEVVSRL